MAGVIRLGATPVGHEAFRMANISIGYCVNLSYSEMVSMRVLHGPQPARADRPPEAALRVLRTLVSMGPSTLAELSAVLGGHRNTTRAQLVQLVGAGLVTERPRRVAGPGRPAHTYIPTVSGEQVASVDDRLDRSESLVRGIADFAAGTTDPVTTARAVGYAWGAQVLTEFDGPPPADALRQVLAAHGFAPQDVPQGIELRACPLLDTSRPGPDLVCEVHQGLVNALAGRPREVVPFSRPGACLVLAENPPA